MYCRQSFSVSAKILCNSLPENIRLCESMGTFKCELKKKIAYKTVFRTILSFLRNILLSRFCKIVNY